MTSQQQPADGGPAFPESGLSGLPNGEFIHGRAGMSLRDFFAAQALTGIMADARLHPSVTRDEVVGEAYAYADAMLSARASIPKEFA